MDVQEYLETHDVTYETLPAKWVGDSPTHGVTIEQADDNVARVLLLKSDHNYLLAVVPVSHVVDLAGLRMLLRTDRLEPASFAEVAEQFPECNLDTILPFGSQYGLTTLVDESLSDAEEIVFEDSSQDIASGAVRMRFADYFELEKPVVTRLCYPETT